MVLTDLLAHCTLRLEPHGSLGTGFFVAPGWILTCAHVVANVEGDELVPVFWQGEHSSQARVLQRTAYPYPDLALLEVPELAGKHPCVRFDSSLPNTSETLVTYGYRQDYPKGSPSSFEFEGMALGERLLTFKLGNVQPGQSGSPLLSLKRGGVCGIIPLSRGSDSLMGGRAVPTEVILQSFPQLVEAQRQFHTRDQRWQEAYEEQVRAERRATFDLERVASAYREKLLHFPLLTQIQVLRMENGIPLSAIYIRLRLASRVGQERPDIPDEEANASNDPALAYERRQALLEHRFSTSFEPTRAVRQFRHCVFLGEPGAGKTTLLKYLASQFLQPEAGSNPLVPITIALSDFARSSFSDLTAFAAHQSAQRFDLDEQALLASFRELIERREALFLLDALDEVASGPASHAGTQEYQQVVDAIENLSGHCEHIVLTARRAGYHHRRYPRVFTELEVLDFRRPDIEQFIEQWFRIRQPAGWQYKIEEFTARLRDEKNTSLLALAANPLLLTQLALVFEFNGDLPQKRFNIYKECTELVQRGWDNARGLQRTHALSMDEEIELLRELAWQMHRQRRHSLSARECRPLILAQLQFLNRSDLSAAQALLELSNERGLLRDIGSEHYAFVHFTFQEYFVAQQIKEAQLEHELLPVLGDPWWEEALLLYAGAAYDASSLLVHLLNADESEAPPEDVFLSKLILAGRCLAEQATLRQPDLRQQIITRLFQVLERAEYQFVRRNLANTLAEIGRAAPGGHAKEDAVNLRLLSYLKPSEDLVPPSEALKHTILNAWRFFGSSALLPALLELLVQGTLREEYELEIALHTTIQALAQPDEDIYQQLFDLVRAPQTEVALAERAAYLLAYTGTGAAATSLWRELNNPDLDEYRQSALAFSLVILGNAQLVETLLAFAWQENAEISLLYYNVLWGISTRHLVSVIPTLLEQLKKASRLDTSFDASLVYTPILDTLKDLGTPALLADLLPFIRDPSLTILFRERVAALCVLLGGALYTQELLAIASQPTEASTIRAELILGLARLADDTLREPFYDLYLVESDAGVREALVVALIMLREPSVFHELEAYWEGDSLLTSPSEENQSLDLLIDPLSRESELAYPSRDVSPAPQRTERAQAPSSLVSQLLASRIDPLSCESKLRNPSIDAARRSELARALQQTARKDAFLPLLLKIVGDDKVHEQVRRVCAETIGRLGETQECAEQLIELVRFYKYHPIRSYASNEVVDTLFHALWRVSRRAGVLVLPARNPDADPYAYRLLVRGVAAPSLDKPDGAC